MKKNTSSFQHTVLLAFTGSSHFPTILKVFMFYSLVQELPVQLSHLRSWPARRRQCRPPGSSRPPPRPSASRPGWSWRASAPPRWWSRCRPCRTLGTPPGSPPRCPCPSSSSPSSSGTRGSRWCRCLKGESEDFVSLSMMQILLQFFLLLLLSFSHIIIVVNLVSDNSTLPSHIIDSSQSTLSMTIAPSVLTSSIHHSQHRQWQ